MTYPSEPDIDSECASCEEDVPDAPRGECPNSKRDCGHHCNCSWTQDACCWCGIEFLGDDETQQGEVRKP